MKNVETIESFYMLLAANCGRPAIDYAKYKKSININIPELSNFLTNHEKTEAKHASMCPNLLKHHGTIGEKGGSVNPIYGRDDFVNTCKEIFSEKLSSILIDMYDNGLAKDDILGRYQVLCTLDHRTDNFRHVIAHVESLVKDQLGIKSWRDEKLLWREGREAQSTLFSDRVAKAKKVDFSALQKMWG